MASTQIAAADSPVSLATVVGLDLRPDSLLDSPCLAVKFAYLCELAVFAAHQSWKNTSSAVRPRMAFISSSLRKSA